MKKTIYLSLLVGGLSLFLGACSLISELIPPQEVEGLFGASEPITSEPQALQDTEVELPDVFQNIQKPELDSQNYQGAYATFAFEYNREVPDLTESLPLAPKDIWQPFELGRLIFTGGDDSTVFPDSIDTMYMRGYLYLVDSNPARYGPSVQAASKMRVIKDTNNCSGGTCTYLFDYANSEVLGVRFSSSDSSNTIERVLEILDPSYDDNPTNNVRGAFVFESWAAGLEPGLSGSIVWNTGPALVSFTTR